MSREEYDRIRTRSRDLFFRADQPNRDNKNDLLCLRKRLRERKKQPSYLSARAHSCDSRKSGRERGGRRQAGRRFCYRSPEQRFPPAVVRLDDEQLQFHHIRGRGPRHTSKSCTPEGLSLGCRIGEDEERAKKFFFSLAFFLF